MDLLTCPHCGHSNSHDLCGECTDCDCPQIVWTQLTQIVDLKHQLAESESRVSTLFDEQGIGELTRRLAEMTADRDNLRGLIEASDAGPLFERLDAQHLRIAELEHALINHDDAIDAMRRARDILGVATDDDVLAYLRRVDNRIAELEHDNETVRFEFDQMRSYAASRERGLDVANARLEAANKRIADLEHELGVVRLHYGELETLNFNLAHSPKLTAAQVARIGERTAEIYNAKPRALTVDACVAAAIAEVCGPAEEA